MSEAPPPISADEAMLNRLAELDLAWVEKVHAQGMAATETDEINSLGRTYQRAARSLRQTLALKAKLKLDAQAALPALLERGGGSLFFTGASGSLRGKANFAPFASAKAALRNLSQSLAREFGPQGIHVGHVVVDGGIEGERLLTFRPQLKDERGPDGMLDIDAIAEAYWVLHHQHRSAWTLELDLRPWAEAF